VRKKPDTNDGSRVSINMSTHHEQRNVNFGLSLSGSRLNNYFMILKMT